MDVFHIEAVDDSYRSVQLCDADVADVLYDGDTIGSEPDSHPIHVKYCVIDDEMPGTVEGTLAWLLDTGQVLYREDVVESIGPYLMRFGRLVPMQHTSGTIFYHLRLTNAVEIIDFGRSRVEWIAERIPWIEEYVFKDDLLENNDLFFDPRLSIGTKFCTTRFLDALARAGAEGLVATRLYSTSS